MTTPQRDKVLSEIAETQALTERLERERKKLQAAVRKTRKARFYGLDRRQAIQPGWAMTTAEIAASVGYQDDEHTAKVLKKRGVFIDDELHGLVMTDDFLECQMEYIRRCRENESD